MKTLNNYVFPILFLLLFSGCEEHMPEYSLSTPEVQRKVLIEEFTGVRCVNCPAGSAEIENLKGLYGDKLVAVSIHAGFFANPYPSNTKELETQAGEDIQDYLGEPLGYPTAVVNRTQFSGKDDLHLGKGEWAGAINSEGSTPAEVNIDIAVSYEQSSRRLDVTAKVIGVEESEEPRYISALVTEDKIHDTQLTPDGLELEYEHNHVLRGMLSTSLGESLPDIGMGEEIEEQWSMTLPDLWKAEDCHVVVFVHHKQADKRVLQVEEEAVL